MHLELMREPAREFPKISEPLAFRSARIWHCNYTSLSDLAMLADLEVLVIATFPDTTFASPGKTPEAETPEGLALSQGFRPHPASIPLPTRDAVLGFFAELGRFREGHCG